MYIRSEDKSTCSIVGDWLRQTYLLPQKPITVYYGGSFTEMVADDGIGVIRLG